MNLKMKKRSLEISNASIDDSTGDLLFYGKFTTFNQRYSIGYDWWLGKEVFEQVNRDAFKDADFSNCFFKYNHSEEALVMASYASQTIMFDYKEDGVYATIRTPATQQAKDVYALVQRGILNKMSWAFTVRKQSFDKDNSTYEILSVDKVYDISVVAVPANPETSIEARSKITNTDEIIQLKKRKLKLKLKLMEEI